MAKAASPALLSANSLHYGADLLTAVNRGKRRTPSELRGEQLKRRNTGDLVDESLAHVTGSLKNITETTNGFRKPDPSKNPRYIETRMDNIFPSRKPNSRLRVQSKKENDKVERSNHFSIIRNQFVPPRMTAKSQCLFPCSEAFGLSKKSYETAGKPCNDAVPDIIPDAASKKPIANDSTTLYSPSECNLENYDASDSESEGKKSQAWKNVEKYSQNTFRGVAELSLGCEKQPNPPTIDMDKALKGLIAQGPSVLPTGGTPRCGDVHTSNGRFYSEVIIPERKLPLDLTLKTSMWILASSSLNWFHKLMTCGATMPQFSQSSDSNDQSSSSSAMKACMANPLHSWVYPQSSLPSSVVSAMTSSTAEAEADFLTKRQSAWEDSFRSLYYLLRKNRCKFFYVCTAQFVVMFVLGNGSGKNSLSCEAYITRSTRGLRSLLREHDIGYTMPLCKTNVEHVATEDLVELSEIEKHNLGQTRRLDSMHDVDNSPRSLLAFSGNRNVHGLYDLLLNYRSFFTMLSGMDVPVLYSTVPFENAAISAPEVRCKEMRKACGMSSSMGCDIDENDESSGEFKYSMEIKGAYIPPWVLCNLCAALDRDGTSFKASFTTELTSIGLNVLASDACTKDSNISPESHPNFGIENATFHPSLNSAFLKGLEYKSGSYTASLTWL